MQSGNATNSWHLCKPTSLAVYMERNAHFLVKFNISSHKYHAADICMF